MKCSSTWTSPASGFMFVFSQGRDAQHMSTMFFFRVWGERLHDLVRKYFRSLFFDRQRCHFWVSTSAKMLCAERLFYDQKKLCAVVLFTQVVPLPKCSVVWCGRSASKVYIRLAIIKLAAFEHLDLFLMLSRLLACHVFRLHICRPLVSPTLAFGSHKSLRVLGER